MRKRKWISYLLVCTVLSMSAPALPVYAAEKAKLAIYPLNSRRVNDDALATAEKALRDSISATDSFDLLSRDEVNKKIGRSGLAPVCDTDECLAELAKTLDVELLVTGNISKMGAIYLINLRLFDALAGQTINSSEMTCSLENAILAFALKNTGSNLVDVERPEPVPPPPVVAVMPTDIETPAAEIIEEGLLPEPAEGTVESAVTEPLAKGTAVEEEVLEARTTDAEPAPEIPKAVSVGPPEVASPSGPEAVISSPEPVAEAGVGKPVADEKVEILSADEIEELLAKEGIEVVEEAVDEPDEVEAEKEVETVAADGQTVAEPVEAKPAAAKIASYQKTIIYSSLGAVVVGGALAVSQISEANRNYVKESEEIENSDEAKAFLSKAESASNIARAGIAVAGIGVAVAVYAYLKGGEPKAVNNASAKKYLPELKLASRNLSLSWRF